MSELFPRALLVEAFPNNPRVRAALEQLGEAIEAAEQRLSDLEARSAAVGVEYQPRSAILDGLSELISELGAIEQVADGQFSIRQIDNPDQPASLLTKSRGDKTYAPHA